MAKQTKGSKQPQFKELKNTADRNDYTDNLGTIISETQSQLLTQFVDNVKNPTAVLMGITMQTANVMDYLVRRGVNPQSIIYLINQPLVKLYLAYQKSNESYFNKANNLELSKTELVKELLKNTNYGGTDVLPDVDLDLTLVDSEMKENLLNPKYNRQQLQMLAYFLDLQDQSRAFSDLNASQNSDTKPLKDKQALDEAADIIGRVITSDIVSKEMLGKMFTQGLVAPFYQFGRKMYKIYNPFYALSQSHFGTLLLNFKNAAAKLEKGAGKDRVRQTIENDFVLFLVQNFNMTNEFDKLMVGNNSVARRIQDLKTKLPSNLVLKQFVPMLNNVIDPETGNKVDNIRLFEKELTGFDSQDLAESLKEIAETDVELYKDLVKVLMYQSGLNISPFNYRQIITIGLDTLRDKLSDYEFFYQDLVGNGVKNGLSGLTQTKAKALFEQFVTLFGANNPQFLKKNFFHSENPYSLKKVWNKNTNKFDLKDRKEKPYPQLGTGSTKKYHLKSTTKNVVPPEVNKNHAGFNNVGEYVEYEDVTNEPTPQLALSSGRKTYEGLITQLNDNQIFTFGSNPVGINGNPAKGTGGAALVATNNGWVEQREKMDNKLSNSGKAWGLTTVAYPGQKRSKTAEEIKEGIAKLYTYAQQNPNKEFLVAYTGTGSNLNGYTNQELADMFSSYPIPDNVVFEKEFSTLLNRSEQLTLFDNQSERYTPSSGNPFTKSKYRQIFYHADKRKGLNEQTLVDDFTMLFPAGVFFSDNLQYAEKYAESIGGSIYVAYLNIEAPVETYDKDEIQIIGRQPDQLPSSKDSVVHKSDDSTADKYGKVGTEAVVFKPEQIKLIEVKSSSSKYVEGYSLDDMFEDRDIDFDNSNSRYTPSLLMYQDFIKKNQLYVGEEVLPFIGESEYYRYLVPMLLKMNPDAKTVFGTDDLIEKRLFALVGPEEMAKLLIQNKKLTGFSASSLNTNYILPNTTVKTVIHELVHLTIQKEYNKGGEFKQKIDELYGYAWDRQVTDDTYGFTSPTEFLAEALSNPEFMQQLNEIPYKEETVFSYLMRLVSDFINELLGVELNTNSVLAEVINLSEQVLQKNVAEISKNTQVDLGTMGQEIINNFESYFPDYGWMNDAQKYQTAKLAEEGKLTLNCKF